MKLLSKQLTAATALIALSVAGTATADPNPQLPASPRLCCVALDVPWDPAMLSWEPGPRETDGVWGPTWYKRLYTTTGFAPPDAPEQRYVAGLSAPLERVYEEAMPLYERLSGFLLADRL